MIELRRRNSLTDVARLPNEYQQVEYLETTGSQYLLLNTIKIDTDESFFEIDFQMTGIREKQVRIISINREEVLFYTIGQTAKFYYYSGNWEKMKSFYYTDFDYYARHVFYANFNICSLDSNIVELDSKVLANGVLTAGQGIGNVGFALYKIYKITTHMSEYIPCYRKADNKPGMYDIINNVFYTNEGTGEFIVGPDVN